MTRLKIIGIALLCALAGWLVGSSSVSPNEGRWVATGPQNLFVLDTHTGEVKHLVPSAQPKPEPDAEPEWHMSCQETREYLDKLAVERTQRPKEEHPDPSSSSQPLPPLLSSEETVRMLEELAYLQAKRAQERQAMQHFAERCLE